MDLVIQMYYLKLIDDTFRKTLFLIIVMKILLCKPMVFLKYIYLKHIFIMKTQKYGYMFRGKIEVNF